MSDAGDERKVLERCLLAKSKRRPPCWCGGKKQEPKQACRRVRCAAVLVQGLMAPKEQQRSQLPSTLATSIDAFASVNILPVKETA